MVSPVDLLGPVRYTQWTCPLPLATNNGILGPVSLALMLNSLTLTARPLSHKESVDRCFIIIIIILLLLLSSYLYDGSD